MRAGTAVLFPGQGSQRPGLGIPWRDHPAWWVVEAAEEVAGRPLAPYLLHAPADELARTGNAQLAVFLASLVAWESARRHLADPVAFAGHSLGQVTALVAAGALSFEDGVRLAIARAELTQVTAAAHPGRMVALLGASLAQAETACRAAPERCWVANDNAPDQVVIGGTPDGVAAAVEEAARIGVRRSVPLDVEGAFHTPLMGPARDGLSATLTALSFAHPVATVVANTDAAPHTDSDWAPRLADHLVRPVRWRESVQVMADLGATTFVEIGPGATLSALVRRTLPGITTVQVGEPAHLSLIAGHVR